MHPLVQRKARMHRRIGTASVMGPSHAREERVPLGLPTRSGTLGPIPLPSCITKRGIRCRNTMRDT